MSDAGGADAPALPNSFTNISARFGRRGQPSVSLAGAAGVVRHHHDTTAVPDVAERQASEEEEEVEEAEADAFSPEYLQRLRAVRPYSHRLDDDADGSARGEGVEEEDDEDGADFQEDLGLQLALALSLQDANGRQRDAEPGNDMVSGFNVPSDDALLGYLLARVRDTHQGGGVTHNGMHAEWVEELDEDHEEELDGGEDHGIGDHPFIAELRRQAAADRAALDAQRVIARHESQARQSLWAEQDRAYQESARADAAREAAKEAAAQAAEEARMQAEQARVACREELLRIGAEQREKVPVELPPSATDVCDIIVDISVPAASPSRLRRRFHSTDAMSGVYAAARAALVAAVIETADAAGDCTDLLKEALALARPGGMRLVLGFPPFAPLEDSTDLSIAEAELHSRERLIARAADSATQS